MDTHAVATSLARELDWLERVIDAAMKRHFQAQEGAGDVTAMKPPDITSDCSSYAVALDAAGLGFDERLLLILALAPHCKPQSLDPFLITNPRTGQVFTEFGGVSLRPGGFIPTLETGLFILSGGDLRRRLDVLQHVRNEAPLVAGRFIRCRPGRGHGLVSARLEVDLNRLALLTTGEEHRPPLPAGLPAQHLTTTLTWDDLILPDPVLDALGEIEAGQQHGHALRAYPGLGRLLRPGYRCLFIGEPGTGKTLAATLLGQRTRQDVYRIDLSTVVSKWIGQTEKHLAAVFDQAERNDWILFFDEADAIFGKRTDVRDSNERYANQEVSYLLRRIEEFGGTLIMASSRNGNIDPAFARRFDSTIHFPLPDARARLRHWLNVLPDPERLSGDIDLQAIAEDYQLTGDGIVNAARHSVLSMLRNGDSQITAQALHSAIVRELREDDRQSEPKP